MNNEPTETRADKKQFSLYGKLVAWTVLVLVAVVVFFLSGEKRDQFIQPGTLSSAHAGVKDCRSCHTAADKSAIDWLHEASFNTAIEDSKLCLGCHELGESPLMAHSVASATLAARTQSVQNNSDDSTLLVGAAREIGWAPEPDRPMQCKTCHQEHSGNDQLITSNTASHCQSCHSQSFTSFENGHPDFAEYPFSRPTSIKFDHSSHLGKHFKDDEFAAVAPRECLSCHTAGNDGSEMQTQGFDNNCASCHADGIRGASRATASGFEFISVPGLDTATLIEKNIGIGHWPTGADESISPFLQLLLASDAEHQRALSTLQDADLMDLRNANPEQLQAAGDLAWQVKRLLAEIVSGGAPFLQTRLSLAVGRDISNDELSALLATLPKAVIENTNSEWFPNLQAELEQLQLGNTPLPVVLAESVEPASAVLNEEPLDDDELFADDEDDALWGDDEPETEAVTQLSNEQWVKAGGWYRDGLTLYYRPRGHADPFVLQWLNLSSEGKEGTASLFAQLSHENAPGQCLTCHSLDAGNSIDWRAGSGKTSPHFTHFRHQPHLNLLSEEGCQSCHALTASDDDEKPFTSNFALMNKSQCTDCHNATVDNQNCLSCHQYHANEVTPALKKTLLQ